MLPIQLDFRPRGRIIAEGVSSDDFERDYADGFYEWIRGYVIQMSPISKIDMDISTYLGHLLNAATPASLLRGQWARMILT